MRDNNNSSIVIDNGSGTFKVGFAGDKKPKIIFPTIIGRVKNNRMVMPGMKESYIGEEAQNKRSILSLTYPIERGVIKRWDDMEKLWNYTFYQQMGIQPENHAMLITDLPFNPVPNREQTAQIMFEKFNTPLLCVANEASLVIKAVQAPGTATATVVNVGDGASYAVPVYQGRALVDCAEHINWAGRDVTEYLAKILAEKVYQMTNSADRTAREIKEKLCYLAMDCENETALSKTSSVYEKTYTLPSGDKVSLCEERFQCPEILFKPYLLNMDCKGLHEITYGATTKCDVGLRKEMFSNIVLAGGGTTFPGFGKRLQKEIVSLMSSKIDVNVTASPERKWAAWLGGSILAKEEDFHTICISKKEYDENGPSIVHRKLVT